MAGALGVTPRKPSGAKQTLTLIEAGAPPRTGEDDDDDEDPPPPRQPEEEESDDVWHRHAVTRGLCFPFLAPALALSALALTALPSSSLGRPEYTPSFPSGGAALARAACADGCL